MFAVPREQCVRMHASSGTTGKPTVVGYTRNDIDTWSHVMARSIRAAGARPGDLVHVSYGYGLFTGGLGAHYGAERLGLTVVPFGGGQTERQVQLIHDFRPDIIMVTPSYMLAIADEFERQGLDPARVQPAPGHLRRRALDQRHARGHRAAHGHGRGRHLWPVRSDGPGRGQRMRRDQGRARPSGRTTSIPRSSIPRPARSLPEGEFGELVFTSLTKEALPIIRYRTRDLTRLLPGTARTMRRMEKITGRSDDMMIVRGVNVFPTQIEELILKRNELTPHYQCILTREGPLDALTVAVETRRGVERRIRPRRRLRPQTLAHEIKTYVGTSARIELRPAGGVERSLGKAKRVLDQRKLL